VTDADADAFAVQIGEVVEGRADARTMVRLGHTAMSSAKAAGAGAVASGRWLADLTVGMAGRLPIRDQATLIAQHGGLSGDALAAAVVRSASHTSAAVGAAAGAVVGAEELAPPAWLAIPGELIVETLFVVAIEIKLVAELHAVYGRPVTGPPSTRAIALSRAWADRRGVHATDLVTAASIAEVVGRGTVNELTRAVRRRLARRMGRNMASLAPMVVGAVAGAEVNRRATAAIGAEIVRDLAGTPGGRRKVIDV
jgi:hypothetical protein